MIVRVLLALSLVAPALFAQQSRDGARPAATGTASISGTVVADDTTAAPVRRATVTLTGDVFAKSVIATTDDAGRFAFTSVPVDRYSLSASKGGYLKSAYGSQRPAGSGTPIVVAAGQRVAGLRLKVLKGSVLTGTVMDENGRPAPGVMVGALVYTRSWLTGERVLDAADGASQVTDDRGMYRIYGLTPGEYVVSASKSVRPEQSIRAAVDVHQVTNVDVQRAQQLLRGPGGAPAITAASAGGRADRSMVNYAPAYYPAAIAVADATTIALGRHEERSGIDVQLQMVPTAKIEGVTSGPDGRPVANVEVAIMDPTPQGVASVRVLRSTRSDRNGQFILPSVNPGRYSIIGTGYPAADRPAGLWGLADVSVEGRDITASISLAPALSLPGRAVFEGSLPRPTDLNEVLPLLQATQGLPILFGLGRLIEADGTFVYRLTPGTYRVRGIGDRPWSSALPTGWLLKSIVINGADVTDVPFEIGSGAAIAGAVITYTDQRTEIAGTMLDAAGKPAPEHVLIAYAADKRLWLPLSRRTKQVRPGADGKFVIRNLPPGDYFISALTDVEDGEWNDAAFLAALAARGPVRITLAEGEKKVQDIKVGGG